MYIFSFGGVVRKKNTKKKRMGDGSSVALAVVCPLGVQQAADDGRGRCGDCGAEKNI
jgi:hypothetical protein